MTFGDIRVLNRVYAYQVEVHARPQGAQGVFEPQMLQVSAIDEASAKDEAIAKASLLGLEVHHTRVCSRA